MRFFCLPSAQYIMATIVPNLDIPSSYKDQQYKQTAEQLVRDLQTSATLYVGNLSFYTTEEQIHELFSKCGEIKRIIMGLDRNNKTPCGFCFVEYYHRKDALACMKYINSTKLDERIIRTDLDPGFREGRQFGRGKSGGQVRDEYRQEFDAGRGGWGHIVRAKLEKERGEKLRENYEAIKEVPAGADEYRSHATSSKKRTRDDDGEVSGPKRSRENNPRFRDERSDDDDDIRQ